MEPAWSWVALYFVYVIIFVAHVWWIENSHTMVIDKIHEENQRRIDEINADRARSNDLESGAGKYPTRP